MKDEKRHFSRVPFIAETQVLKRKNIYDGVIRNISLKGIMFVSDKEHELEVNDECNIKIQLQSSTLVLRFTGELVSKFVEGKEKKYGFKFTKYHEEAFQHLRRLLELNLGDEEAIHSELVYMIK